MLINNQKPSFSQSTFPFLEGVTTKHYFSAYQSAFKDGVMFALYKNEKLYLRKSTKHLRDIKQAIGFLEFLEDPKIKMPAKSFYYLPKEYYPLLCSNSEWLINAITEYKEQKEKLNKIHQDKIRYMCNLDFKLERLLNKAGIQTITELILLGESKVTVKLIEKGFDVSPLLLFKIYGAINRKYIYHLTQIEKETILQKTDQALYEAGLRKRFYKS